VNNQTRLHKLCTQAGIFSDREQNLGLIDLSQLDSPQGGANAHCAERACDPISRQHYREMAAHYRSLSIEHQEIKPEHESTH
jgi:hypothetical protein